MQQPRSPGDVPGAALFAVSFMAVATYKAVLTLAFELNPSATGSAFNQAMQKLPDALTTNQKVTALDFSAAALGLTAYGIYICVKTVRAAHGRGPNYQSPLIR
ncbi:MAG: hypothetical protein WAO98_00595 [Alphaproteobacteria bacterium]